MRTRLRDYEWTNMIHIHVQEKLNKFIARVLHRLKVN